VVANQQVPQPIELGPPGERVFLVLFVTGARRITRAADTRLVVGGEEYVPLYLGASGDLVGVEQLNSSDDGLNWTAVNSGLTRTRVLSLTISGNAVYAGTDNGLFRSTNQGVAWTEVCAGLTDRYIVALGIAPDDTTLLAATSSGVFRSSIAGGNQGQSWTPVTNGLPERTVALTFAQQRNRMLAGTVNGFFVSEDNGANWRQINSGLLTLQVGALAVSDDTVLAGTRSGGVFVSTLPQ
jgi:ligand-binding sensor domain-containing protein